VDDFMIGMYGSGTTGEFSVVWTELGGKLTPQLRAYDDSWSALAKFRDLLDAMAEVDDQDITPAQFYEICMRLGIKDLTPRTQD
jgi:hypothetical protein